MDMAELPRLRGQPNTASTIPVGLQWGRLHVLIDSVGEPAVLVVDHAAG